MSQTNPVNFYSEAETLVPHLVAIETELGNHANRKLNHLVALRASQINQCAYCVQMHIREALADGESQERLDRLIVWRHVSDFSPAEKAVFAYTEALTNPQADVNLSPLRGALREHFDDQAIAYLTAKIAMINLWNRIQIANH